MSIYPFWNPTRTVNSCGLIPLIREQTYEQEYNDFTTSNRQVAVNTVLPLHSPKLFKEPGCMLPQGHQNMYGRLQPTPMISRKFAGEGKCRV